HVMDSTSEHRREQKKAVETVLKDLNARHIPRIDAMNKTDRLNAEELNRLRKDNPNILYISAQQKSGLNILLESIQEVLNRRWVLRELDLSHAQVQLIREAYRTAQVLDRSYHDGKVRLQMRITPENWSRLCSRIQRS